MDYAAQTALVDVARHCTSVSCVLWSLLHSWDLDFLHVCGMYIHVTSVCFACLLDVVPGSGWLPSFVVLVGAWPHAA